MAKEYWLIRKKTTIGCKNPLEIIDKLPAKGLREAENYFKIRNNFEKLLTKGDLTIVKSEKYYQ